MCKAQNTGGAAHILLHCDHAGSSFEIESTGIETHTLADQRNFRMLRIAPGDVDQPRRAGAGASNGMNQRVVGREQFLTHDY